MQAVLLDVELETGKFGDTASDNCYWHVYRAIFVGNLPENIKERELEDLFFKVKDSLDHELG